MSLHPIMELLVIVWVFILWSILMPIHLWRRLDWVQSWNIVKHNNISSHASMWIPLDLEGSSREKQLHLTVGNALFVFLFFIDFVISIVCIFIFIFGESLSSCLKVMTETHKTCGVVGLLSLSDQKSGPGTAKRTIGGC